MCKPPRWYKIEISNWRFTQYLKKSQKYTVYGIDAVNNNGYILESHTDIFFDRLKAEKFISLCNDCELELIHLPDVVEDAITEQYAVFC